MRIWYARWESNPQNAEFESAAYASSATGTYFRNGRGVEPLNPHRFVVAHLHNAYPNFRANLDFGTNRQPQPLQHCHSSSHHKGGMLGLVPASLRCAKIRSFLDLAAEAALLFSATALCHADPFQTYCFSRKSFASSLLRKKK